MKATKENVDELFSHTSRLANIASDVAAITGSVQGVEKKADIVSPFVARLKEHLNDTRLVFNIEINKNRKGKKP